MDPEPPRTLIRGSLLCLFLVALTGTIMRGTSFFDPLLPHDHWLHTHSHLAMLGWVYLGLLAGIKKGFLKTDGSTFYRWTVGLTFLCIAGMALSFPFQGYGGGSIAFSSLFLITTYMMVGLFLKKLGWYGGPLSTAFLRAALFYLVLSSIGAWVLGPIVAQGMKEEPVYRLAIYWYLHFQYNGWMSFALLGLLYRQMEEAGVHFDPARTRIGFWTLHIACIPAYSLSTLWTGPGLSVFIIGGLSAILQLIALFFLFPSLKKIPKFLPEGWRWPIGVSLAAFGLKLLMQALSPLPYFAELLSYQRDLVIGYLHLVFLGFVSFGLFGLFLKEGWLSRRALTRTGLFLFLTAFLLTEGLIFMRGAAGIWPGMGIPYMDELLFGGSLLFPLGVGLVGSQAR